MIRIITDSASDITQAEAKASGIDVLPLTNVFGDQQYLDGVTIDHRRFYEMLIESDVLPTTSCVSPGQYEECFDKYPNDQLIVITVSGKLSGCYQSAKIAAEDRENIAIVDSNSVTIGQKILVEYAVKLLNEGKSYQEIVEEITDRVADIRVLGVLDTLEYLRKGGRIPAGVAVIGGLLSIKPVVTVTDGLVEMLGKARGSKNGRNLLNEYVEKRGPIDFELPFYVAYSGLSSEVLDKYIEDSKHLYAEYTNELPRTVVGATIGTHVGPGAVALAFFVKK